MHDLICGALVMGYAIAALFFLRFWRRTRDRLFAIFAVAFLLLAANRIALVAFHADAEHQHYLYLLRLVAYTLIIAAIVDKNRPRRARGGAQP
jgi:peptidoglycan/LPS O-acetylase OafA/YrhL